MSQTSDIEWTDATWNPVRGCHVISPGCKNCYAKTFAERFRGVPGHPYEQGFDLRLVPEALDTPRHWKKPRRIFVNSMSDLFHKDVPIDFIAQVMETIRATPQHTYQALTKRAERMRDVMGELAPTPIPNLWLGVSVESQVFADERIPLLMQTPASVRFLSCEPLLGPLSFKDVPGLNRLGAPLPDWIIVGGESGPGARRCDVAWIRGIVQQARNAGVRVFVKQVGRKPFFVLDGAERVYQVMDGDRKGSMLDSLPSDLRVREFPRGAA